MSPSELLYLARDEGLSGLCITDHDILAAYNQELFELAKKLGITLFTGVEFSTRYENENVHLLGYGISVTPHLLEFCARHRERRKKRNRQILENLNDRHG